MFLLYRVPPNKLAKGFMSYDRKYAQSDIQTSLHTDTLKQITSYYQSQQFQIAKSLATFFIIKDGRKSTFIPIYFGYHCIII